MFWRTAHCISVVLEVLFEFKSGNLTQSLFFISNVFESCVILISLIMYYKYWAEEFEGSTLAIFRGILAHCGGVELIMLFATEFSLLIGSISNYRNGNTMYLTCKKAFKFRYESLDTYFNNDVVSPRFVFGSCSNE
jgi:hypothetical protein